MNLVGSFAEVRPASDVGDVSGFCPRRATSEVGADLTPRWPKAPRLSKQSVRRLGPPASNYNDVTRSRVPAATPNAAAISRSICKRHPWEPLHRL